MKPHVVPVALALSLVSPGALGQEAAPGGDADLRTKIKAGLRLGYGLPLGKVSESDTGLSDRFNGMLPLWLDLGYVLTPNILVGVYGQYAIAQINDDFTTPGTSESPCAAEDAECSGSVVRFGVQGWYSFTPERPLKPWVGLGFGYEIASLLIEEVSYATGGFEFANLQGGADFELSPTIFAGPFASFSFGQYSSCSISGLPGGDPSCDIEKPALHMWLVFGLRGVFGF